jgi:predicted RNase H-like HicB family nuclease
METVIIETARTENGYSGACKLLPGWIVAEGGDFKSFKEYVKESIDFYIECAKKDGIAYPSIFDKEYELIYKFDVQSLLEYYRGIFSFSALQTVTGINQKQLAHYASGVAKPRKSQVEKISAGLHRLADELNSVTV